MNKGETPALTIEAAAQAAGVSPATIRNWIKTACLEKDKTGRVSWTSLRTFLDDAAGKEKLHSRANKSQKDPLYNHREVERRFMDRLSEESLPLDFLAGDYEESLSDSHRNKEGVYYTPGWIVADMLPGGKGKIGDRKFCDPSCGSGNFVMRALEIGFKPENVYGFDVDPVAVELTKKRIFQKTGYSSKNIQNADFLEFAAQRPRLFDYLYTNPPWGKKIQKTEKEKYAQVLGAGKSTDTSALFFFACLRCLKKNGSLGLLLPEAFFNIAVFEDARKKALDLKVERLVDYGRPFRGIFSKAQAVMLTNKTEERSYPVDCETDGRNFRRTSGSFKSVPKSIFNFHADDGAARVIEHIFKRSHITLAGRAKWGLGIVTGNNKKFLREKPEKGFVPVYKGSDITCRGLKEPRVFLSDDLSLYQQAAPLELYRAPEKIIYKFISSRLCFFYDTEQRYILNSANLIIPDNAFPFTHRQLADLLNSDIINWLFTNLFHTHKILRGDLECLPIHADYFTAHPDFAEKTYLDFLGIKAGKNGVYCIAE